MPRPTNDCLLVTGGSGFIGVALVKRLLGLGYSVKVLTRRVDTPGVIALAKELSDYGSLQFIEGDITSRASLRAALKDVRYVFHSAALVNAVASFAEYEKANVIGTENICKLSTEHSVEKLLYVSTSDVFGLPKKGDIITEKTSYARWGEHYADTKIAATQVVRAYQSCGLVSTIIYPGWVYGPGDRAFLPALVKQLRTGWLPLWRNNGCPIQLVYIDDLIDGIILAFRTPSAHNEDFLLLDAISRIGICDLCEHVAAHLSLKYHVIKIPYAMAYCIASLSEWFFRIGLSPPPDLSTGIVKSFGYPFVFSTEKARRLLNWSPETPFDIGITNALTWYCTNIQPLRITVV
jgi:nucleoside-diphosphate-sugar epimerase